MDAPLLRFDGVRKTGAGLHEIGFEVARGEGRRCSARPAPARPRCCGCWPGWNARMPDGCCWPGEIWRRSRRRAAAWR